MARLASRPNRVSSRVAGSFSRMGWLTFCLKIIDSPRSKRASWPRYSRYWTTMGLSSPSSFFFCSITLSGAWPPSIEETGSPGMTRSTTNTRVSMMKTMGMASRTRVMM